jgi:hypothetical protein
MNRETNNNSEVTLASQTILSRTKIIELLRRTLKFKATDPTLVRNWNLFGFLIFISHKIKQIDRKIIWNNHF